MTSQLQFSRLKMANLSKRFLVFCLFLAGSAIAQPGIEYDRILESAGTRIAASDGGHLIFDSQNWDYHIVKYNAAGSTEWEKTYRGNQLDHLETVIQTADGGYLLGGSSYFIQKECHRTAPPACPTHG